MAGIVDIEGRIGILEITKMQLFYQMLKRDRPILWVTVSVSVSVSVISAVFWCTGICISILVLNIVY